MNTKETITIFAQDTLEDLFSLESEELERILDLDLPDSAFLNAAKRYVPEPTIPLKFSCGYRAKRAPRRVGLSGLRPQIFIDSKLPLTEAKASAAKALWNLARYLYEREEYLPDLDAWISSGFVFELKFTASDFISSYSSDSNMLSVDTVDGITALATFKPIRKLVL